MADLEVLIKVEVGNASSIFDIETAKRSRILRERIETDVENNLMHDVHTIQSDPDIFVHVWKYLVNEIFPLHYGRWTAKLPEPILLTMHRLSMEREGGELYGLRSMH
jgi:hypothetical protein